MAVEEWGLRRRQNFVNLLLLIDGLDRDEEERKVKRERVIWIREWFQRRERGAYNQLVQESSSSTLSTAVAILFVSIGEQPCP